MNDSFSLNTFIVKSGINNPAQIIYYSELNLIDVF